MKRHSDILSSPDDLNSPQLLQHDRELLVDKLALECWEIMSSVPEEIWKMIFTFEIQSFQCYEPLYTKEKTSSFESLIQLFQLLNCVCRSFSTIIPELVRICFLEYPGFSDWVVKHYVDTLSTLSLNRFQFPYISDEGLSKLTNLTHLETYFSPKNVSNNALKNLSKLTSLRLINNEMISDEGIRHLTQLTSLSLQCDKMISDNGLSNLSNLTQLDLESNTQISDSSVSQLTNLTQLNLAYNKLISDSALSCLKKLKSLCISDNNMITEESLKELSNLTSLNLRNNLMVSDENLGLMSLVSLTSLTELDITNNYFLNDESVTKFTNLVCLRVFEQGFGANPTVILANESLSKLTNLTELNLGSCHNQISDDSISLLTNLKSLSIYSNPRISDISFMRLTNLEELRLGKNEIISDKSIKYLTNLTSLYVEDNDNITINSVQFLTKLKKFEMNYCTKITKEEWEKVRETFTNI